MVVKAKGVKTPRFCFFFFVKRQAILARGFCGAGLGPSCRREGPKQENEKNEKTAGGDSSG